MKQLFTLLMAAFLISCGNAQQQSNASGDQEIKNISVAQAQELITNTEDLQIIDVRTDQECAAGMIDGASQINIGASDFHSKIDALDKNGKYLVYCRSGARSGKAMRIMQDKGFKHVYNLSGGYISWSKQ